jgi:LemA protein
MKKWALGCGGLGVALLLVLIVAFLGGCSIYNRIVGLDQKTDSAAAQVQNVYQRRLDLIPNLVKTVEGAANFERSTLNEVIQARATATQVKIDPANLTPDKMRQFEQTQGQLSSALSRLLVTVERYPELKANANFRDLQAQLEGTENRITVERGNFNDAVREYNTAIKKFPGKFVAGFGGFAPKPYFEAVPAAQTAPQVQFDFGRGTNK